MPGSTLQAVAQHANDIYAQQANTAYTDLLNTQFQTKLGTLEQGISQAITQGQMGAQEIGQSVGVTQQQAAADTQMTNQANAAIASAIGTAFGLGGKAPAAAAPQAGQTNAGGQEVFNGTSWQLPGGASYGPPTPGTQAVMDVNQFLPSWPNMIQPSYAAPASPDVGLGGGTFGVTPPPTTMALPITLGNGPVALGH